MSINNVSKATRMGAYWGWRAAVKPFDLRWAVLAVTVVSTCFAQVQPKYQLTAYGFPDDESFMGGTRHVIFVASDGHIYEAREPSPTPNWQITDLSAKFGFPGLAKNSNLASFVFEEFQGYLGQRPYPSNQVDPDDSQNVVYVGLDGNVHLLSSQSNNSSQWSHKILNACNQSASGPLVAYVFPGDFTPGSPQNSGTKHVVFMGTDSNIYELYSGPFDDWDGHCTPISALTLPIQEQHASWAYLTGGYAREADSSEHVIQLHCDFAASNCQIYDYSFTSKQGWKYEILGDTSSAIILGGAFKSTNAYYGAGVASDSQGGGEYLASIFNLDDFPYLWELRNDFGTTTSWFATDLAGPANYPANANPYTDLAGYIWPNDGNSRHVIYTGVDQQLHEVYYSGNWGSHSLNSPQVTAGGAPLPDRAALGSGHLDSKLANYLWDNGESENVIYVGEDQNIYELFHVLNEGPWYKEFVASWQVLFVCPACI
jgi:hypothetical protein